MHRKLPFEQQNVGQLGGLMQIVVFPLDEHILKRNTAMGLVRVIAHGIQKIRHRIPAVHRHHRRADLIVGRVQTDRQIDLQRILCQLADPGDQPHRRHREIARPEIKAVRVVKPLHRAPPVRVVVERLAHPHKHRVRQAARHPLHRIQPVLRHPLLIHIPGNLPQHALGPQDLMRNIARRQILHEAQLRGRAKHAAHGTARLTAHAHRRPVRIHHQHRLNRLISRQREHRLARQAPVPPVHLQQPQGGNTGVLLQKRPERRRQIRHLIKIIRQQHPQLTIELLRPERRLPPGLHLTGQFGQTQIQHIDF